jgi:hypothetical protein
MGILTNEMPALRAFGFVKCSSLIFPSYYLKGWVPGIARIFLIKKKCDKFYAIRSPSG